MTRLKKHLSEVERKKATDRLYKIRDMIDAGASRDRIREAIIYTAQEIWPPWSEVEDDQPVNLEAA